MKISDIKWTQEEFKAYVLLYAANSDFVEKEDERKYILTKINTETYEKIHAEFDKDNDYQSLQKIITSIEKFEYSQDKIQSLTDDIMEVLLIDDEFDSTEKCIFMMLKKILKK